jgi:hypothetical protein
MTLSVTSHDTVNAAHRVHCELGARLDQHQWALTAHFTSAHVVLYPRAEVHMRVTVFATFVACLVSACALKTTSDSNESVSGGSDAQETEGNVEALSSAFVGGTGTGSGMLASSSDLVSGDQSPQGLGDAAKSFFQPSGCLTVTDDTTTKTASYVFANCSGPYGINHVSGTVTVTYSSSAPTQLTLNYAATGLKINAATIDWTAKADITANGSARDMVWAGHFTGTTGRGRAFERTNNKDIKWTVGVPCVSVSGTSDGTVTGKELKTTIKSWNQCAHSCPEAGSEISIIDVAANQTYDVKYDANDAVYTGPAGKPYTFTPACAY